MVILGKLIAWTMVLFGCVRIGMGWWVATSFIEPDAYAAATARYIGSGTTGDAIDRGLVWILVGVVVGLLAHIAGRRHKVRSQD